MFASLKKNTLLCFMHENKPIRKQLNPNPFEAIDSRLDIIEGTLHRILRALHIKDPAQILTRQMIAKEFHVSPFMTLDMQYRWRLTTPGQKVKVNIDNIDLNDNKLFAVSMRLDKTNITTIELGKSWITLPFSVIKVLCLIYWQALKLLLKRLPLHSHAACPQSISEDSKKSPQLLNCKPTGSN